VTRFSLFSFTARERHRDLRPKSLCRSSASSKRAGAIERINLFESQSGSLRMALAEGGTVFSGSGFVFATVSCLLHSPCQLAEIFKMPEIPRNHGGGNPRQLAVAGTNCSNHDLRRITPLINLTPRIADFGLWSWDCAP